MVCYNKTNKGLAQLIVLALVTAVIGALSIFTLYKWTQKPVAVSTPATAMPTPTQALAVQPGATLAVRAPLPAVEPTDLEALVAPIALYPDTLLAQLLPARKRQTPFSCKWLVNLDSSHSETTSDRKLCTQRRRWEIKIPNWTFERSVVNPHQA